MVGMAIGQGLPKTGGQTSHEGSRKGSSRYQGHARSWNGAGSGPGPNSHHIGFDTPIGRWPHAAKSNTKPQRIGRTNGQDGIPVGRCPYFVPRTTPVIAC